MIQCELELQKIQGFDRYDVPEEDDMTLLDFD